MTLDRQIEIMEKQLSNLDSLMDKMQYVTNFFNKDDQFTNQAVNIVVSNIMKSEGVK